MSDQKANESHENTENEPVWTYRGFQLKAGEFNTAMVHLYRGELSRANTWRQRLDSTTIGPCSQLAQAFRLVWATPRAITASSSRT